MESIEGFPIGRSPLEDDDSKGHADQTKPGDQSDKAPAGQAVVPSPPDLRYLTFAAH
ncbi:hypothetical protein ACIHCQ_44090 [Streptomyces sp. NPDC052236]|uniref:hypothetical protein n=1 Tax=Streptomyces sp. NPDC052236 TaxID=3365686 RepID=UPI0037D1C3A1